MLQVAIYDSKKFGIRTPPTMNHSSCQSASALSQQQPDPRVLLGHPAYDVFDAVSTVIIYNNQFIGNPQRIGAPPKPAQQFSDAARLMRDRRIKRLPVTNATGHPIGIISRIDVLSVFCHPDGTIRHEVMDEVVRGSYLVRSEPSGVVVHNGIVTLTGRPETDQAGHDLVERVRHLEGVVTVRDQLSYAGTKVP